jgi:steroid 5-alpha reductase family enzyme
MSLITDALTAAVALNLLLFLPAYFLRTDKLTDISYSLTFIALALFGLSKSQHSTIDKLAFIMVMAWALRLGTFLFIRILKQGKDSRFDEMRKKWFSFVRFWFFQGLTVFVVILPGLLIWRDHSEFSVGLFTLLGVVIWALGLLIEALADYQKYNFKLKGSKNWIDEGVWRSSRHPNYLGEITVWTGYWLFAASVLPASGKVIALASPLYIISILMFFSGVPLLEKSADKKWGSDKKYQTYKKHVPVLVPSPSSLARLFKTS